MTLFNHGHNISISSNLLVRVLRDGLSESGEFTSIVERHQGMYAKARRGEIKVFTGIDNPHEPQLDAKLELDPEHLQARGLVRPEKRVEPA